MDFNNPDFKGIIDAFSKFASAHGGDDIAGRITRALASGGKAAVDKSLEEFPKTFITRTAKDFYALISSQEIADSLSSSVTSFDEEKVKEAVDNLADRLKDPEVALQVAKQVKEILSKTSTDDIEAALDGLTDKLPADKRMMVIFTLAQAKPLIDSMRTASDEEVAEIISSIADNLPSDLIALQLGALTREVTPERISKHTQDAVDKLPSPKALGDIVHGIGKSASEHLESASKSATPGDAANILKQFITNIGADVSDTLAKDKTTKKKNKPQNGDFNL
jgi:uncharacterized membrane protein YheB (UPF0754 family)